MALPQREGVDFSVAAHSSTATSFHKGLSSQPKCIKVVERLANQESPTGLCLADICILISLLLVVLLADTYSVFS
jgi:hypothetical protein